jgi:hypothetical protein
MLRDFKVHLFLPFIHSIYRCFISWLIIILLRIGRATRAKCSSIYKSSRSRESKPTATQAQAQVRRALFEFDRSAGRSVGSDGAEIRSCFFFGYEIRSCAHYIYLLLKNDKLHRSCGAPLRIPYEEESMQKQQNRPPLCPRKNRHPLWRSGAAPRDRRASHRLSV